MVKWCAVPNCKTGSRTESKRSVFRVPKDTVMWKKWEEAIPGVIKLFQTDVVCEKHFDDNDISREWIKLDANGQVIAQVSYKYPKLKKLAVPTKFGDVPIEKENSDQLHGCAKRISTGYLLPMNDNSANSQTNPPSIENQCNIFAESLNRSISPLIVEFPETKNIARVDSPAPDIGISFLQMEVSSCEPTIADSLLHHEPFKVPSPIEISKQFPRGNASTIAEFSAYVPESWVVGQVRTENMQHTFFSYSITKLVNGEPCPVTQKCVTLDVHGTLKYFVYGRLINLHDKNLERVLKEKEMLSNVLEKFKGINVCSGLGDNDIHLVPVGGAYQDYVEKWRSKDCSLLSKKKRCNSCIKSRKCIQQRAARLRNCPTMKRIGGALNPVDRCKLVAMRNRIRREKSQKIRAKDRVKHLMT